MAQAPSSAVSAKAPATSIGTGGVSMDVTLFAFSRTPVYGGGVTINKSAPNRFDISYLYMDVSPALPTDTYFELPFGIVGVSDLHADMYVDFYDTEIFTNDIGDIELTFQAPTDMQVTQFCFEAYDMLAYADEALIYNVHTELWEPLADTKYTNAAPYLDAQNRIRVLFIQIDSGYFTLPSISIGGLAN